MTPETPNLKYPEIRACWISVDILIEHFPDLEEDIFLLDDAEIAYLDKEASKMIACSYWVAMEIVIKEYIEEKKNDQTNEEGSLESSNE